VTLATVSIPCRTLPNTTFVPSKELAGPGPASNTIDWYSIPTAAMWSVTATKNMPLPSVSVKSQQSTPPKRPPFYPFSFVWCTTPIGNDVPVPAHTKVSPKERPCSRGRRIWNIHSGVSLVPHVQSFNPGAVFPVLSFFGMEKGSVTCGDEETDVPVGGGLLDGGVVQGL